MDVGCFQFVEEGVYGGDDDGNCEKCEYVKETNVFDFVSSFLFFFNVTHIHTYKFSAYKSRVIHIHVFFCGSF